jgi:tryptophan halogenase
MGKPITNITIVGGGTAGWIAAAYLNQRLQWGPTANPNVHITVIESPSIGTVGVGEATVPTLKFTMKMLGISEAEFMQRCDATFKLGILFDRFNKNDKGELIGYVHPFTGGLTVKRHNPGFSFKRYGLPDRESATDQDFVRSISMARDAFEANKGPRALNGPAYGGALQYAYHIDAGKLAEFLKEICIKRGVKHVRDNVVDVKLDDRGFIKSLQLQENGEWPIELAVDCAGFRGLLINQVMKEPFESYGDYLLNDRAIALQVTYPKDNNKIPSLTLSKAMSSGWVWDIPLRNRRGTGYVYCSKFISDDEALAEFKRDHLQGVDFLIEPYVLKMRVGRNRRSWVKNCVALGLSSGFLEPLESTSIMSIELQARWLVSSLPSTDFEEPLAEQYNTATAKLYDEIRDFLGMHFDLNDRQDTPFWKATAHEAKRSDALKHHLELWQYNLPSPLDPRNKTVFSHWSVLCILMGKNFYKNCKLVGEEIVSRTLWQQYWTELSSRKQRILGRLANHRTLVEAIVARAVSGESVKRDAAEGEQLIADGQLLVAAQPIMAQRPIA